MLFYRRKAEIEILSMLGTCGRDTNSELEHDQLDENALDMRTLRSPFSTADMSLKAEAVHIKEVNRVRDEEVQGQACQDQSTSPQEGLSISIGCCTFKHRADDSDFAF